MKLVSLVITIFILSSCATYSELSPAKHNANEIEWQNGRAITTSIMPKSTVVLKVNPLIISDKNGTFDVAVFNASEQKYLFSENDVSANVNGHAIRVFGRSDWIVKTDKQAREQQFALGLAAAASAYNASQSSRSTTTGYISNSYGSSWGSFNTVTSNPAQNALAIAATAKVYSDISRDIRSEARDAIEFANSQMLSKNTMQPHEWYGGQLLTSQLPSVKNGQNTLLITVTVNGEIHEFKFDQLPKEIVQEQKKKKVCFSGYMCS